MIPLGWGEGGEEEGLTERGGGYSGPRKGWGVCAHRGISVRLRTQGTPDEVPTSSDHPAHRVGAD